MPEHCRVLRTAVESESHMHTTELSSGQINGRDTISRVAAPPPDIWPRPPYGFRSMGSKEDPLSLDSAVISRTGGVCK
jgi:hypothetical protein